MAERKQFRAIKGTRDILPPDSALWNWFEQTARETFASYNFGEIRLPIFEETELFARSIGTETDVVGKEMYTFDVLEPDLQELDNLRNVVLGWPDAWEHRHLEAYQRMTERLIAELEPVFAAQLLPRDNINTVAFENLKRHAQELMEATSTRAKDSVKGVQQDVRALHLGQMITLRPEATASVCRAYIEHNMYQLPQPVKLYYMGPMFRRDRPQKGRYRQFYQIGAELLDHVRLVEKITADEDKELRKDAAVDGEVIEMVMTFFSRVGLEGVELYINSIGHHAPNCRRGYVERLREALLKVQDELGEDSRRRIETNPLRVLDSKLENEQRIIEQLPRITEYLCTDCKTHYIELKRQLDLRGVKYRESWRLVRGLDYYMRTTFEITAKGLGSQNAVCGGGRYDDLVRFLGGPPTKGIGFAIGSDRAILSIQEGDSQIAKQRLPALAVFIAWMGAASYPTAVNIARKLREAGVSVELPAEEMKFKKSLGLADKLGARYALIIGEDEVASGSYSLKNLADGKQEKLGESALLEYLESERRKRLAAEGSG